MNAIGCLFPAQGSQTQLHWFKEEGGDPVLCPESAARGGACGCRYVSGDPRFRSYNKGNPRKMVQMWAEKEMRNLARLHAAGIRCPQPLQLRLHVLVMDFIGLGGVAALRLKVAPSPQGTALVLLPLSPRPAPLLPALLYTKPGCTPSKPSGRCTTSCWPMGPFTPVTSTSCAGCEAAPGAAAEHVHGAHSAGAQAVPGVPPRARRPQRVQYPGQPGANPPRADPVSLE